MHTDMLLVGAGGHAKVVLDALQVCGVKQVVVLDDDMSLEGKTLLGISIQTPVIFEGKEEQAHIAVGNNAAREQLSQLSSNAGVLLHTVTHPKSIIAASATVKEGCFIAAQAILAPDSKLGRCVIVNHGAIVDHDCIVGDFSHIAPQATLGGGVAIGKGCLIGAGAVVLPGITIADRVTVGAGAVVVEDILQEGLVVRGVPAKP